MCGTNWKKRVAGIVAGALMATVLLVGCGSQEPFDPPSVSSGTALVGSASEEPVAVAPEIEGKDTFLVYFSGIDVFGDISTKSRSDVNILAAVNRKTRTIQLVSTPRDYYVQIPVSGEARDKLTHAGLYGVECSEGALENLYGVDIDYYVRVNFTGFEEIIYELGGIDVYSEYDFTVEPIKHYTEGMNHLSGIEALAFVRERHAFEKGDVQRGINKMEMLKALIARMSQEDVLKNFGNVMAGFSSKMQTDMPMDLLQNMVQIELADADDWTVETYYVTGSGGKETTYSTPGQSVYVMMPNEEEVAEGGRLLNEVLERVDSDE